MIVHDCERDLGETQRIANLPIWKEFYQDRWPRKFVRMVDYSQCAAHQQVGVDREVVLTDHVWLMDEKIRWNPYNDVLLEYWSDEERKIPGWICKEGIRADYFAYAVAPRGWGICLPVAPLQALWRQKGDMWKQLGRICVPNTRGNRRWNTISCPVSVKFLREELGRSEPGMFEVRFTPMEKPAWLGANHGA